MRLGILWMAVFALVFAVRAAEAQKAQEPSEWHSATEFTLEGKGWKETESPYDRFPPKAHGKVPENVWGLSQMSAGIAIRFQSDAPVSGRVGRLLRTLWRCRICQRQE